MGGDSIAKPSEVAQKNAQVLSSENVDSGSEDEWDDIEDVPLNADVQVIEAGSDDSEVDVIRAAEVGMVVSNDMDAQPDVTTMELPSVVPQITNITPEEKETVARVGVSWNIVSSFSFEALRRTYEEHAPITWHLLWKFVEPKSMKKHRKPTARVYRPKWIVSETSVCSKHAVLTLSPCRLSQV